MSSENSDRYDRLPPSPSSVYTDHRHCETFIRRFREYFEGVFMDAAMQRMREKFPDEVGPRSRNKERGILGTVFVTLVVFFFRVTPEFIRSPMTRAMFRYSDQNWPDSVPMGPGDRDQ